MKTCPVCNTSKHTSAFSAVKHICNLCHLDGKTYTPPEKARKPTEAEILQAELAARTLARRRLIHFVQRFKPDYQAGWVHHDICRRLEQFVKDVEAKKSPRLLLCMPPRAGKALALDTPVPTPTGWTTMGDLKVGDTVFSDTGNPCKVVSKSPVWVDREAYVVKTDMGDSIVADAEHEWVVRLCRKRPVFKTKTTKYLAERTSNRAPLLAAAGSLNLPERDLPIHPYVLGVWLGDGRTSSAAMCSADPEIVEHVSLIEGGHTEYENRNGTLHFRVGPHYRNGATKAETLQGRLRTLGLLGNKHIPIMYLRASREQRLELLQGLIDTDGYVADNGLVEFCNTNKLLAEGVRELVNSLGVKASLNTGRAMCDGKDCGPKYRVLFMLENAAKLTRKRVKTRNGVRQPGTYLTFEPAGRVDTVCIEVDSPSHQFLCGRTMIPTHNSELTSRNFPAWALGHHPEWEIIAASHTQSLALSFSRHLRDKIRDPAYEAVFPDCVLDPQSQSVENWNTTAGGGYLAAGIGTGITGRGAHCLPLTERIVTSGGVKSLNELIKDTENAHYVLSYSGTLEYRKINAFLTRKAAGYYRVTLSDGTSFCATGEHPVCVDLGGAPPVFRRLDDLRTGESVVTFGSYASNTEAQNGDAVPGLQHRVHQESVKLARSEGCVRELDPHVQQQVHGCDAIAHEKGASALRRMQKAVLDLFCRACSPKRAWRQARVLLKRVLRGVQVKIIRWGEAPQLLQGRSALHYVQKDVPATIQSFVDVSHAEPFLLEGVLPRMATWSSYPEGYRSSFATVLPVRVQGCESKDAIGESSVCSVHVSCEGSAPQGREHREQRIFKSGTCVSSLPYETSRRATTPFIESIEYVEGDIVVGDIEVDGAHNFVHESGALLLNCLIVDDPVKDMTEADSQLVRDNTWDWYSSTAYTRLAPGGGVLGIMTLWNDDDWGGRTITYSENGEGDKFEIVRYPAINEGYDEYQENETYSIVKKYPADPVPDNATLIRKADSALHPDRYDTEMLLKIKRNLYASGQQRVWSALYQQNPAPEEGAYFTKDLFRYYSTPPRRRGNFIYQAWDFAIAEGQENDYTVGATILQDERDALHVLDVKRFKSADSIYIVDVILDYAAEFDADLLGFEDGQIWKTMQAQFDKRCDERRMYPTYEILKPLTDKKARANPLKGRMQAGKVYFPDKAPWLHDVYSELLRFPAGKHDDCSSANTLIDSPHGPQRIIDLRDGDEILTYDGQSVLVGVVGNHHCTGVKMVLEVTLEDGTRLELTAGHPVLTARGYVYAGDLTDTDEVVRKDPCTFYDTDSSGPRSPADTGSQQQLGQTESASGCTATRGSKNEVPSHQDAKFTMSTETAQTTTSPTSSASHEKRTTLSIATNAARAAAAMLREKFSSALELCRRLLATGNTSATRSAGKLSTACARAQLAEQSSSWVRRTTTRLLTVLRIVSKRLAESTPSGSTSEPCHASSAVERSYLGGTESVIASSALSHAVTNTDTQTSTSVESVKGVARPCGSRLGALRATAEIARLLGRTCEKPNAQPAGQRFYPETRMAAYSAIENVLTSCEDLSVTQRSMSDSNRLFVKVVSIREIGFQETYNFDVAGTRNFLVENGIVVHNCVDALAWAVRLTLTRSAPKVKEPDRIKSWKDKLSTGGSLGDVSHMAA